FTSGAFQADGRLLVVRSSDGTSVWDVAKRKRLWSAPTNVSFAAAGPLSSDGRILVGHSIYPENAVLIWALPEGRQLSLIKLDSAEEIISPDGRILAMRHSSSVASPQSQVGDGIRIWDLPLNKMRFDLPTSHMVTAFTFSSNSRLLAVGYRDGSAQLWDVDKGEAVLQWKPHSMGEVLLAFSPDGALLASIDQQTPGIHALHL